MKFYLTSVALIFCCLFMQNCSSDKSVAPEVTIPKSYGLAGHVEKGPFVQGSTVSVQPLDNSLSPVGSIFNGEIQDNTGSFNIGQITLEYPIARLSASGYFFNELSGTLSSGTITLNSIVDLSDHTTVNVNLLSHLKAQRIQKLVASGKSFADADRQAQLEVLTQFGLQDYSNKDFSATSISDGTNEAGVIIAISCLLLKDRTEAQFTEYLSKLSSQIANNGIISDEIRQQITDDTQSLKSELENISLNIITRYKELGKSITMPDLRFFFDWNNDGIAGNENATNPQVSLSQTEVHFDKNGGTAEITVTTNLPLSIQNPDPDSTLPDMIVDPLNSFFAYSDISIECTADYKDNKLTITVEKTQSSQQQSKTINFYDIWGTVHASVNITLDGDPDLSGKLSKDGETIVNSVYKAFANGISWSSYIERSYTGISDFHGIKAHLSSTSSYNYTAFRQSYYAVSLCTSFIDNLHGLPFFRLLRAILYTDLADKWGNVSIVRSPDEFNPQQTTVNAVLEYTESELNDLSSAFKDIKSTASPATPQEAYDISKDVWRIAMADVQLRLAKYDTAADLLRQIVDSNRYSLSGDNDNILILKVPEEVASGQTLKFHTSADVVLSLAECYAHLGNTSKAKELISQVATAKNITVPDDATKAIDTLRKALQTPRYFAFLKRNSLGNYESYQYLWPIPQQQLDLAPGWSQNPGYNR